MLVARTLTGRYVGVKLFESPPTPVPDTLWLKENAKQAIRVKQDIEEGKVKLKDVAAKIVSDLNLSEEEKLAMDKEWELEEKKYKRWFLSTEFSMIELDRQIKESLSLQKADTDKCLKLLNELSELDIRPLMLLKHPATLECVRRLTCYVGNVQGWALDEQQADEFARRATAVREKADQLANKFKALFTSPTELSFWEHFAQLVVQFKVCTKDSSVDQLYTMVRMPKEMLDMPTQPPLANAEETPMDVDTAPAEKKKESIGKQNAKKRHSKKEEKQTAVEQTNGEIEHKTHHQEKTQDNSIVVQNDVTAEVTDETEKEHNGKDEKESDGVETEKRKETEDIEKHTQDKPKHIDREKKMKDNENQKKVKDTEKEKKIKDGEKDKKIKDNEKDKRVKDSEKDKKVRDSDKDKKAKDNEKDKKVKDSEKDKKLKESEKVKKVKDTEKDTVNNDDKDKKTKDDEKDKRAQGNEKDKKTKDGENDKVKDDQKDKRVKDKEKDNKSKDSEKEKKVEEKDKRLEETDKRVEEKDKRVQEKDKKVDEKEKKVDEKESNKEDKEKKDKVHAEKDKAKDAEEKTVNIEEEKNDSNEKEKEEEEKSEEGKTRRETRESKESSKKTEPKSPGKRKSKP